MSSNFSAQEDLILNLKGGEITEAEFCEGFPVAPSALPTLGFTLLEQAMEQRDGRAMEFAMIMAYYSARTERGPKFDPAFLPLFIVLAEADWHTRHEDVLWELDQMRLKTLVDVFYRVALTKHAYAEWDDFSVLGVKCIWGLGNTGTVEAIERLAQLTRCGTPILESNAREQLGRLTEKGASEVERTAARAAFAANPAPPPEPESGEP